MQTNQPDAPATALSLAQATQAFADWESDYRANPGIFYTAEETAAMEVASVSEARAIHFMALLRQRQGDLAANIDRPLVQAMLARGKRMMVQAALWGDGMGQPQQMYEHWKGFAQCAAALLDDGAQTMALHDEASVPHGEVQSALACLPNHCERLTFTQMKRLVCTQGIDRSLQPVTNNQVDTVVQLQNGVGASVEQDDKHAAAVVDVGNGAVLHSGTPGTSTDILAEGGAA